jgi:hypothetical protein
MYEIFCTITNDQGSRVIPTGHAGSSGLITRPSPTRIDRHHGPPGAHPGIRSPDTITDTMGHYRVRATIAIRCCGELLGPEHDTEDAFYVGAMSEWGARSAALATWPDIRTVLSVQECFY